MTWENITTLEQLAEIKSASDTCLIFKHSTRCVISDRVKKLFEKEYQSLGMVTPAFLIDILQHRAISNAAAETFQVHHESPQLLLIHQHECVYAPSHADIRAEEILEEIQRITNTQN